MPRFPSAQGRLNHEPDSTLAVTKTCPKDGVHLSKSWTTPVNLGPDINTEYEDTMPSATADGSRLYFMSDRPGGLGGMDIFEAVKEVSD